MYLPTRALVDSVADLSPHFRRIVFTMPGLISDSPVYDQRIKLIVPPSSGRLPDLCPDPEWYRAWLALPEGERGSMRTYSIRRLERAAEGLHLAVDFVMHEGSGGPACAWAVGARAGDELIIIAPSQGPASGGIEFDPAGADEIILLGDETAAPAIARILEDLAKEGISTTGQAFIEVPTSDDVLPIDCPASINVQWLPRDGAPRGELLAEALGWHLTEHEPSDELIWETPTYSASGAPIPMPTAERAPYFWIAGESSVVTSLRRHLVRKVGIDRGHVAFMGYWREGVAMKG